MSTNLAGRRLQTLWTGVALTAILLTAGCKDDAVGEVESAAVAPTPAAPMRVPDAAVSANVDKKALAPSPGAAAAKTKRKRTVATGEPGATKPAGDRRNAKRSATAAATALVKKAEREAPKPTLAPPSEKPSDKAKRPSSEAVKSAASVETSKRVSKAAAPTSAKRPTSAPEAKEAARQAATAPTRDDTGSVRDAKVKGETAVDRAARLARIASDRGRPDSPAKTREASRPTPNPAAARPPKARPTLSSKIPATPIVPVATATLPIQHALTPADLKQLTGKKFRLSELQGQTPGNRYNALYFESKADKYGVGVQLWHEPALRDTRSRFEQMKATYPNVQVTGNVTNYTFFANWQGLYYLVFMDLKKRRVVSVSTGSLTPNQLYGVATQVRDRLLR